MFEVLKEELVGGTKTRPAGANALPTPRPDATARRAAAVRHNMTFANFREGVA